MTVPARIRSKSLHHIAFATRDVEATLAFYSGTLGMPLVHCENHRQGDGFFRHFFFDIGAGECIGFFEVRDVGERADFGTGISVGLGLPVWVNHLAFRLDSLDDLAAREAQLGEAGVENLMRVDHGWCTSIYLLDPNGIMVEFCVTTDAAAFEQTEAEALALLRQPLEATPEAGRKDLDVAERVR